MKYGFVIPGGSIDEILAMAVAAEEAGWDGVFYWDAIYIKEVPLIYDAWTVLAAMAVLTKRIRIGALLTSVNRRRPWKLAREAITVDQLSNGRLILPTGLGSLDDGGYTKVREPTGRRTRAELLDEGLEIITGLWRGLPFSYTGKHYRIDDMTFKPSPIQKPRIPIWVVGAWPSKKSLSRAMKYDGLIPTKKDSSGSYIKTTLKDIQEISMFLKENRVPNTFELVQEGETPIKDRRKAHAIVEKFEKAGATWWIETRWTNQGEALPRLRNGPPRTH